MEDMLIIGIAGGSGSGKSTVAEIILNAFGEDNVTVIRHDDYYKALDELTYEERCKINYDCPDAFDTALMAEHLKDLKCGKEVICPVYDYKVHNRSKEVRVVKPTKVLLIDGILILSDDALRQTMDIKIFVDTDDDIRILRRIKRDMNQRKRSLESIMSQYLTTVKPMHEAFVEPSKKFADIIIPEGAHNTVAMEMLLNRVARHIENQDKDI